MDASDTRSLNKTLREREKERVGERESRRERVGHGKASRCKRVRVSVLKFFGNCIQIKSEKQTQGVE